MNPTDSLFPETGKSRPAPTPAGGSPPPFSSPQDRTGDVGEELNILQRHVSNLLILLLVVSGTFAIFLLQQIRYDRADLAMLKIQELQMEQSRQVISNYNQRSVPAMQTFLNQVGEYAKTHPDVLPILARYGLVRPAVPPADGTAEPKP